MQLTPEQEAILEAATTTSDNLCIVALAGTGKTSTLEMIGRALSNIPILYIVFNKRNSDEAKKRMPPHVECRTINSIGHSVWAAASGKRLSVDKDKMLGILKRQIAVLPAKQQGEAWEDMADTLRWLRYAKRDGWVPPDWRKHAKKPLQGSRSEWIATYDEEPTDLQQVLIASAMSESIQLAYNGGIDFDDQVYMPVIFGGPWPKFACVLCDEVQDMSPINHEMLEQLIWQRGIIVGDPFQSIYAFRGAVQNGMKRLVERFNMRELPLSVTFRVPQVGVKRARFRVPHYQWFESATEGTIHELETRRNGEERFEPAWGPGTIPDGAAVVCRNNAPLFSLAIRLLRSGRNVKLVGMEVGPGLVRILKKLGPPTLPAASIRGALDRWKDGELRSGRKSVEVIEEKFECLVALACRPDASNLGQAITMTEQLFRQSGAIQLLSIHKAKGLEWDTVFHLDPHRIPSKYAKEGTEEMEQELNARYVAETRFKRELYLVTMEGFDA